MRGVLSCVVLVAFVTVVSALEDDKYSEFVEKTMVDENVDDGANAISRFLGFKCPKGYRCLPVLECLPCDYGSYKSNEGSDLCENCPAGCTTLRKGAKSWKECVPKCPPGYEESECGKTCTKCRAGFYKSSWKNKKCNQCPKKSSWNRNMVGMKKKSQCFQSTRPECHSFAGDVVIALDVSRSVSEEDHWKQLDSVNEFIDAFDVSEENAQFAVYTYPEFDESIALKFYSNKSELQNTVSGLTWPDMEPTDISPHLNELAANLPVMSGNRQGVPDTVIVATNSRSASFPDTEAAAEHLKSVADKVFAIGIGGVNEDELYAIATHEDYVVKAANSDALAKRLPGLTMDACKLFSEEPEDNGSPSKGDGRCYLEHGTCGQVEYEEVRLVALSGTNCRKFCQCAHASTGLDGNVTYYWEEHVCAPGTSFDPSLPNCIHATQFECHDSAPLTTLEPVSSSVGPTPNTGVDGCLLNDPCTKHDYEVYRLKLLGGSNCTKFCHCAHDEGSAGFDALYYWEEQTCPAGTLFDVSLPVPVCNHDYNVQCRPTGVFSEEPEDSGSETTATKTTKDPLSLTTAAPGDSRCYLEHGSCGQVEYEDVRLVALSGTNCRKFCQCAHALTGLDGNVTYYWEEHVCAPGTSFDASLPNCIHEAQVDCYDTGPSTTVVPVSSPVGSTPSTGVDWCALGDSCTKHDYEVYRLKLLGGSNCTKFCHCAHDEGSAGFDALYYWEEQTCPAGTLFDVSLPVPVCNHDYNVQCTGIGSSSMYPKSPSSSSSSSTTTTTTTTTTAATPGEELGEDNCLLGGCSGVDYYSSPLSNCLTYCQCDDATKTWIRNNDCGPGTLFDNRKQICDHDDNVDLTSCTSASFP